MAKDKDKISKKHAIGVTSVETIKIGKQTYALMHGHKNASHCICNGEITNFNDGKPAVALKDGAFDMTAIKKDYLKNDGTTVFLQAVPGK